MKRNIGQQNWTNICVFKKSEALSTLIYLNAKSKVEKMINWAIKNRSENVIRKIIFRVKVAAPSPSFFLSFLVKNGTLKILDAHYLPPTVILLTSTQSYKRPTVIN